MEKQALSWRGLMTTLQDFTNITIGTVLMPAFKSLENKVAHIALQVLPTSAWRLERLDSLLLSSTTSQGGSLVIDSLTRASVLVRASKARTRPSQRNMGRMEGLLTRVTIYFGGSTTNKHLLDSCELVPAPFQSMIGGVLGPRYSPEKLNGSWQSIQ